MLSIYIFLPLFLSLTNHHIGEREHDNPCINRQYAMLHHSKEASVQEIEQTNEYQHVPMQGKYHWLIGEVRVRGSQILLPRPRE